MKTLYLTVSAACALTVGAMNAMHQDHQPAGADALIACIELKDLLFELGAVLYKGKLDEKALSHLSECFHKDKIAALFSVAPDDFDRFIDTDSLSQFCTLILNKSNDHKKKIRALQNILHIEAWEEALECNGLEPLIVDLSKLIYFSGTVEEKRRLLARLKRSVSDLLPHEEPRKLDHYIDIHTLDTLIDDLQENKQVSPTQIVDILNTESLQNRFIPDPNSLGGCIHLKNFLSCIVALIKADQEHADFPYTSFLPCIRWDGLFINLPTMLGKSPRAVQEFFVIPHLRRQISQLQDGVDLTADGLRSIVNWKAFESVSIKPELIESCINFEQLAKGLNALRQGEQSHELKEAFNFSLLENLLGVDITSAFNSELPESMQRKKFAELMNHLNHPKWIILIGSASTILWLAGHLICHPCMEAFEPQSWYTAGPLLAGALYLCYQGTQLCEKTRPLSIGLLNGALVKGQRALARLLPMKSPYLEELQSYKPQKVEHEPLYIAFIQLLTEDHLHTLKKSVDLVNLFEKPRTFVTQNPAFIEGICVHNPERANDRLHIIEQLLEGVVPFENLPHKESITAFTSSLNEEICSKLPHVGIITIGSYCPEIFFSYIGYNDFLETAATYTIDHQSVICLLLKARREAKQIYEDDLAQ